MNPDAGNFAPGGRTNTVYRRLREWIVDGELQPGEEISQVELARRLGVSRTPLREALRQLERDGLINAAEPQRLVQISPLSMADLEEVYALRIPAEALTIWHSIPQMTVVDLAGLRKDLKLVDDPDLSLGREAHRRFHAGLWKSAGPRMRVTLWMFMFHAERYQGAYLTETKAGRQRKRAEHKAIVAACEQADREAAREAIVDHLASTALSLMGSHDYEPALLSVAVAMARSLGGDQTKADGLFV